MKKLFIACLMAMVLPVLAQADSSYTSTRNARNTSTAQGVNQSVAVADASTGYTQRVDSVGAAQVAIKPQTLVSSTGTTLNNGTQLVSGAARVSSLTVSGIGTSAGDYVLIYDNTSATGTPALEIVLGTAKETVTVQVPGGMQFSTGVYADANSTNVFIAAAYNQ